MTTPLKSVPTKHAEIDQVRESLLEELNDGISGRRRSQRVLEKHESQLKSPTPAEEPTSAEETESEDDEISLSDPELEV